MIFENLLACFKCYHCESMSVNMSVVLDVDLSNIILITGYKSLEEIVLKKPNLALNLALLEYLPLEYNIQVLTIETTVRKP